MRGVFLHVLADTLGSVGVIISSLLIHFFGWHIADPVVAALTSLLILASALPLAVSTATQLLQRIPSGYEGKWALLLAKVSELDRVVSVRRANL